MIDFDLARLYTTLVSRNTLQTRFQQVGTVVEAWQEELLSDSIELKIALNPYQLDQY